MSDLDKLANQLLPFILRKVRQASGTVVSVGGSTVTDAQIFQAVLSQDGSGSGLDADTVDGYQAADFALSTHDHDDLIWWRVVASSARLWGGEITDNEDGTVTVAAGAGLVLADEAGPEDGPTAIDDGQASAPSLVEWDEDAAVSLTDNAYNYIYITAAGAVAATTDFYSISFTQEFTVGRVYRAGTTVTIRLCGTNAWNFNRRVQLFGEEVFPVVRAKGLILGSTGTRNLTITAGILWAELVNRFTVGWGIGGASDFNSATGNSWTYYYRNGSGGWTTSASVTQINNTQYDDGDGTLGTLTANRYGVHWVYVVHDATVHILFGQGDYTLAQAEASTPPASIPGLLAAYGTLIGRVLVQKSSNTLLVESAFDVTFASSGVISHNDLSDLTTGDPHTQYILKSTFDANTLLIANTDDTPTALTVGASTIVGRGAAGGIAALSASGARTVLGLGTMATEAAASYVANSLLTTRGDIIVRNATVPERLALTVPSSPTINFLGVVNGETQPTWKSASSNPGAAAAVLATDASGYAQVVRMGVGTTTNETVFNVRSDNSSTSFATDSNAVIALDNFDTTANNMASFWFRGATSGSARSYQAGLGVTFLRNGGGTGNGGATFWVATRNVAGTLAQRLFLADTGNLKIAGSAARATTEGTNHLDIFDGTAPAGTLANGCSIYSTAGELRVMDAAGNATLISPHDDEGYWIFDSKDTVTGRRLRIDVEKMLRAINERFGWDFIQEFADA